MNERRLHALFGNVLVLMPLFASGAGCGGATTGDDETLARGGSAGFGGMGPSGGGDAKGGRTSGGASNGGAIATGGVGSGGDASGGTSTGGRPRGGGGGTTGGIGNGGATTGGVLLSGGASSGGAATGGSVSGGAGGVDGGAGAGGMAGGAGGMTGGVGGSGAEGGTGGDPCVLDVPVTGSCAVPRVGTVTNSCIADGINATVCVAICGRFGGACRILAQDEELVTIECPPICIAGRRPVGYVAEGMTSAGLGAHFALAAELEHASVSAFRGLRAELCELGAPRSLLRALSRAARDEQRHTRSTRALARRFGASPRSARVVRGSARSLEAIALHNVAEGCVRELYGALLASYQARSARDAGVRATMSRIAREETRHAALSLRVQRWLEQRLDPSALSRVAAARRSAGLALRAELATQPETPRGALAGLPTRVEATRLFDSIAHIFF